MWGPGRDFAPLRIEYTPFVSPFRFLVAFPIQSSTSYFATFIFTFEFRDEFFSWTRERRMIGCMDRFTLPDAMVFLDESFAHDILSFGSDFMLDML